MDEPLLLTEVPRDKSAYAHMVTQSMTAVCNAIQDAKAYAGPEPKELSRRIRSHEILPEHGIGFDAALLNAQKDILPNMLRTGSTQYLAHLHSPALLESLAAEIMLSGFNQSMDSWDQSPAATETEVATVDFLCRLFGYKTTAGRAPDGCFTSGGSQSNLTGILLARDWYCKNALGHDIKKLGLPPGYRKLRLYASEVSHFSMEKSCHLLGLGYDAVVKVPVDSRQKMDVEKLSALIGQDKAAGNIPFCVVATVGTTDYGSIDDIGSIKELTNRHGMWLHADAAYGGALVMSDTYARRTGPLCECDSITVDFHKMFLLPISCSAILVRDGATFEPLELHADYLNREEDEADGYTNLVGKSLQTTRRFDALKVWLTFQAKGKDGYQNIIDTCMENAAYAYGRLRENPVFSCAIEPELSSVVFRVRPDGDDGALSDELNKKIRRELLHKNGVVIGQTSYGGRTHLKFTMLNPCLSHKDIDGLIAEIEAAARALCKK